MGHSLRSLRTESVQPQMKMTDITDTIENIKTLYSPYFPLEIVRDYVMQAISEAVETNQVHNRDPIGGSNENLFLPLLKLLDRLLLVNMIRNEDVEKLLIMIHPETWDTTYEKGKYLIRILLLTFLIPCEFGSKLHISYCTNCRVNFFLNVSNPFVIIFKST